MAENIFIIPSCLPVSSITLTSFALIKLLISILSKFIYIISGDGGGESSSEKFFENKSTSLANFYVRALNVKLAKFLMPYLLNFNPAPEICGIYPDNITPLVCSSGVNSKDAALSES